LPARKIWKAINDAVEEKVLDMISQLLDIPQARQPLALGDGIEFENHANILSNNAE
jgi:hypothetical protein